MAKADILLKTALCCIASDGTVAPEELELLHKVITSKRIVNVVDAKERLKEYANSLMSSGTAFLNEYLSEVKQSNFDDNDALDILEIAFGAIEADNEIEYSEIAFFKKIRNCLSISDGTILAKWPDKEDYLQPDIMDKLPFDIDLSGIIFKDTDIIV